MSLRYEPNVAHAAWFTTRAERWARLCSIGPSGFEQYGRLFHPLREGDDERNLDDLVNIEGHLEEGHLRRLTRILSRHTRTPDDCFFGLWEGFGDIEGSPAVGLFAARRRKPPRIPPAFPPEVLEGPRVEIPARSYLLFRGSLTEAGEWGAADLVAGQPRTINSPNLMWPADQAWFVATEIDHPWTGVGGSSALLGELMADPVLDVELVSLSDDLPYWR